MDEELAAFATESGISTETMNKVELQKPKQINTEDVERFHETFLTELLSGKVYFDLDPFTVIAFFQKLSFSSLNQ